MNRRLGKAQCTVNQAAEPGWVSKKLFLIAQVRRGRAKAAFTVVRFLTGTTKHSLTGLGPSIWSRYKHNLRRGFHELLAPQTFKRRPPTGAFRSSPLTPLKPHTPQLDQAINRLLPHTDTSAVDSRSHRSDLIRLTTDPLLPCLLQRPRTIITFLPVCFDEALSRLPRCCHWVSENEPHATRYNAQHILSFLLQHDTRFGCTDPHAPAPWKWIDV